jgi:hypothetical protein
MITIKRWYLENCTLGFLQIGDLNCFTLELPWRDNERNASCIPAGTYEYFARQSPKNGSVLELRSVEDRSYIQIHSANYTSQLLGCIAVGDGIKLLSSDGTPYVSNSKNTLLNVLERAGESGEIRIID